MEELSHFFESIGYFPVERRNHGNLYRNPYEEYYEQSCEEFLLIRQGWRGQFQTGCQKTD
jgi:hypothetical protein